MSHMKKNSGNEYVLSPIFRDGQKRNFRPLLPKIRDFPRLLSSESLTISIKFRIFRHDTRL